MKNKAVIFDLDGTVVDSPQETLPSAEATKVIDFKKDEYYFSAATGRSWSWSKDILLALNLVDPCIVAGGTIICNPQTGEKIWQKNIEEDNLKQALDIFRQYPNHKMLYNDYGAEDYYKGGILPADYNNTDPVYFLESIHTPNQDAHAMLDKLFKIKGLTCLIMDSQIKEGASDIHIINKEATKEQAIAQLLKILQIDRKNTIGIGDGSNDIHLFNAVEYKVAMKNAVDALKKDADLIIGDVKDNGFTKYIQSL